jgi:hypothetical protein
MQLTLHRVSNLEKLPALWMTIRLSCVRDGLEFFSSLFTAGTLMGMMFALQKINPVDSISDFYCSASATKAVQLQTKFGN